MMAITQAFRRFDPDLYDPRAWARLARESGMRYAVLTTKHHEGFCLWDSAFTDYKATRTPYGKDLVRPFVEAVRAERLRVGFYYSLIDWHHPDFSIDAFHPQRNQPDAAALNTQRDMRRYRAYLHGQVRELLTQYGRIDGMCFDFSYLGSEVQLTPFNPDEPQHNMSLSGLRPGTLTLELPVRKPNVVVPVVELFLKER